jgi:glutamate synthase domain-containing protein 3
MSMQATITGTNISFDEKKQLATIDVAPGHIPMKYKLLNDQMHQLLNRGFKTIDLVNVVGQRFIGAAIGGDIHISIHGTPGNDLGIFMDGPTIEVFGNVEDQSGNTMNGGRIIVHGSARDVTGLSARGGEIFVQGDGGYRCGVHIKQYQAKRPIIVFGGRVRDFFGEYMAGGLLVVLGLHISNDGNFTKIDDFPAAGKSIATGIHGGKVILARAVDEIDPASLGTGAKLAELDEDDRVDLQQVLGSYCGYFNLDTDQVLALPFCKITAMSKRPFASNYCSKMV